MSDNRRKPHGGVMYSASAHHLDSVIDLYSLVLSRKREKNFQYSIKQEGLLYKQVAVNLKVKSNGIVLEGHFYIKDLHKFKFEILITDLLKKKFILTIYKKDVKEAEVNLIYDEIILLKNELKKRLNQKGGPDSMPTELYLESGKIETDRAKMRYIQAHIDTKYPNDLLEIYKSMNFKIVGKGHYPELKNWEKEAIRLGIAI